MVPIKTTVEDMERLLAYMSKQIGWVELGKIQKTLGMIDNRKIGAMAALGLIERDGGNLKLTERGRVFATGDQAGALRAAVADSALYRATVEWIHYGSKKEVAVAEIGQYWESHHKDTLGGLKGDTLKDGAICFGRVIEGANLGTYTIGRGGHATRLTSDLAGMATFLDGNSVALSSVGVNGAASGDVNTTVNVAESSQPTVDVVGAKSLSPVAVTTSPSVHVNVEIHIAADATADTVKEIFKNMARYVLDKPVSNDDNE